MDTIFALSSGRPPAAISVIRISGAGAFSAGTKLCGPLPPPREVAVRDVRHSVSGDILDRALILSFAAPASATGEDVVEIQCHGGRAVVDSIVAALAAIPGLRAAQPGEFTRRAFACGRIDLTEAEGLADLIEAETEAQRKAAMALADGGLRRQIEAWRETVVALSAMAERAIDYVDDAGDGGADPALSSACSELATELQIWLSRPRVEPLKDGVRVVVAGPPNAGKSSLINAIAGLEKAIVTDVPGTTRDAIDVPLSLGGLPIVLTDTAGLRDTADPVEAIGVARAEERAAGADILIWLGAAREMPDHPRSIIVHPKADLDCGAPARGTIAVSSKTGAGIGELLDGVAKLARAVVPAEDSIALNRRQAALIGEAARALGDASGSVDLLIVAESFRSARGAFDRLTGRAGIEDVLDALFSRFCLGK